MLAMSSLAAVSAFTFQYASIKPPQQSPDNVLYVVFTFQYASIKPVVRESLNHALPNLHFNMLLLNPA